MTQQTFKIATIASAHGIRGEVKLHCFLENPRDITHYLPLSDKQGRRYQLTITGTQKELLIVKCDHVADRNQAELLRGVELFAETAKRPADEEEAIYVSELVGLEARLENGAVYGKIHAVVNYGAGDILEITRVDGSEEMIPFTENFIGDVTVDKGYLVISPPDYIEADA